MTIPRWDIWNRAQTGPLCPTKTFEMKRLFPTVKKLIREYGIAYQPNEPVPLDDALIDSAFQAGLDLLCEIGILCTDTERVIHLDKSEIAEALKFARSQVTLGEGKDEVTLVHRDIEDKRPPAVLGGLIAVPVSDEIAMPVYEAYAREAAVDLFTNGTLVHVRDAVVSAGSPFEMYAEKTDTARAREALRRAGRPGVPLLGTMYTTGRAAISTCDPECGYRPTDLVHCYIMPNMKTDYDTLCKAQHFADYGIRTWGMGTSFVGGLAGGPEGAAIVAVAECLAALMLYQTDVPSLFTPDAIYGPGMSARKPLWADALGFSAVSRNVSAPLISWSPYQAYAGPCTDMYLYEIAASTVAHVVSGSSCTSQGGGHSGGTPDYVGGPLDAKFVREVAHATTALNRTEANDVVLALLARYEDKIEAKQPPVGKTFQECNDMESLKPTQEYVELYEKIKEELTTMGLILP